jgi:hypothetical protein
VFCDCGRPAFIRIVPYGVAAGNVAVSGALGESGNFSSSDEGNSMLKLI